MANIKKPKVDAMLVGFGWTGAIMGMELTAAGLNVLAHARGAARDTVPDFAYPRNTGELEPHFDIFEKICRMSGKAGNLKGVVQSSGNPFEGPRANEFPLPPMAA